MTRTQLQLRPRAGMLLAVSVAAVGLAAPGTPAAGAAPDPCAASEIAKTVGNVAINASMYLDSHPKTNQAISLPQVLGLMQTVQPGGPSVAQFVS